MWSSSVYLSLTAQLARLVASPGQQRADRQTRAVHDPSADGCGCCPLCGKFVFVEFADADASTLCPQCRRPIEFLDALGDA